MKKVLIGLVVLVAVIGILGFYRGWFEVGTSKEAGKVHADLTVNKEKFTQDKEKLKKAVGDKSRALKDRLAHLRDKAKGLSGDAKSKADKEIDELAKKHESLEGKLKEIDEAAEDKFESLRGGLTSVLDEDKEGRGKEGDKPN
jgi:hypothetical protein